MTQYFNRFRSGSGYVHPISLKPSQKNLWQLGWQGLLEETTLGSAIVPYCNKFQKTTKLHMFWCGGETLCKWNAIIGLTGINPHISVSLSDCTSPDANLLVEETKHDTQSPESVEHRVHYRAYLYNNDIESVPVCTSVDAISWERKLLCVNQNTNMVRLKK